MTRAPFAALAILICCSCRSAAPQRWEHGWKTKHVIATRYRSEMMGFHIGFRYPLNPNDCDRDELFQLLKRNGGGDAYEAGGHLGAEMFVIFKDVRDKETADRKLLKILPSLESLVSSF